MKIIRTSTFRLNYNMYQHAFLISVSKRYIFCLKLLSEWIYYFIKNKSQREIQKLKYQLQRRDYSRLRGFPIKLYEKVYYELPSCIGQNIIPNAIALAQSRNTKNKIDHTNIKSVYFEISDIYKTIRSNNRTIVFPFSKYLKQQFSEKVKVQIPAKVFNHLNNTSVKSFYFRFRFTRGQWWIDIIKKISTNNCIRFRNRVFAAIDLNLNDICFIDEISKQPILLSLKQYVYKLNKYISNTKKVSKYIRQLKNVLKLYAIRIVQYCYLYGITRIAVGKVSKTMLKSELSKIQRRVWNKIPWTYFIQYLTSYGQKYNIYVYEINERYTSKASALDNDVLPEISNKSAKFSGRRITRGGYLTNKKIFVHADVNAAANILRKAALRFSKTILFTKNELSAVRRVGFHLLNKVNLFTALIIKKSKDYMRTLGLISRGSKEQLLLLCTPLNLRFNRVNLGYT